MHRQFRKALDSAEGVSQFVIVVVADIRGFSSFCLKHESPDIAMYIKRVYMRLIDNYFANATFFKPTGDGLLVAIPFTEKNLAEQANATIAACLRCVVEFPEICSGDPMVNFSTPTSIGFGVARGIACCLRSGDETLDYSGQLLNLAARLMDLARPSGVVIDQSLDTKLLDKELADKFNQESVYLRGIAEEEPRHVSILTEVVELDDESQKPIVAAVEWTEIVEKHPVRVWRDRGARFAWPLPGPIRGGEYLKVKYQHPCYRNKKRVKALATTGVVAAEYKNVANLHSVSMNLETLVTAIRAVGVKLNDELTITMMFAKV